MPNEREEEETSESDADHICTLIYGYILTVIVALIFPCSIFSMFKIVQEYERAVVFRLGRLTKPTKGPGIIFLFPCLEECRILDTRTKLFDVPPQNILTSDSVTVAMDAVVYYRIKDAILAVTGAEDADESTKLLAQTTLRNVLGAKSLSEILNQREQIAQALLQMLDEVTDEWGIAVERVEIKNVRLPQKMQRAMAAEAEAARKAKARVVAAEGEMNASVKLKEAADIMSTSPNSIELRCMQTLNTISAKNNATVILPIPNQLYHAIKMRLSSR